MGGGVDESLASSAERISDSEMRSSLESILFTCGILRDRHPLLFARFDQVGQPNGESFLSFITYLLSKLKNNDALLQLKKQLAPVGETMQVPALSLADADRALSTAEELEGRLKRASCETEPPARESTSS